MTHKSSYSKQIIIVVTTIFFIYSFSLSKTLAQPTNTFNDRILVNVDLNKSIGPMYPAWAWFGYDEPNYTYMKDGKKLLTAIAQLSPDRKSVV